MSDDFFSFFVISVGKGAVSMVIQSITVNTDRGSEAGSGWLS